jgi:hypothetical protein
MEKTIVKVTIIIAIAIVLATGIHALSARYYISTGNKVAYKIDRITGKSWVVAMGKEVENIEKSKKVDTGERL